MSVTLPVTRRSNPDTMRHSDEFSVEELVIARLEEAGKTLLSMPDTGYSTRLRTQDLGVVREMIEAYGWEELTVRPPTPSPSRVTRMWDAWNWLGYIPNHRYVVRRIVAARSLVHPLHERHLLSWRKIGTALGADYRAVQQWHAQGIQIIVREKYCRGEK